MKNGNQILLQSLSVFFPCYNEEKNIAQTIAKLVPLLPAIAQTYEVILVNDGSTDGTLAVCQDLAKKYPFISVIDQTNQGYGGALSAGFASAKYEWVFFSDADLQFDFAELPLLIKQAPSADLVIGYRKKRAEGFVRWFLAFGMKVWNFLVLGFPPPIKDPDCAFKLINRKVLLAVSPLTSKGNIISTELLLKAAKKGFRIRQVGVSHFKRVEGRSNCGGLKDIKKVVKESIMLRNAI